MPAESAAEQVAEPPDDSHDSARSPLGAECDIRYNGGRVTM